MADAEVVSAADRSVVTGILEEKRDGEIILRVPDTDYRIRCRTPQPVEGEVGKRISGVIRVQARRIDQIKTGGRYIEPIFGPPHRIGGMVLGVIETEDALVVSAGAPVVCKTNERQSATQFEPGRMVSMYVVPDATFTQTK